MHKTKIMGMIIVLGVVMLAACTSANETPESVNDIEETDIAIEVTEATTEAINDATEEAITTLVAVNPTAVESGNTPQEEVIAANVAEADIAEGERLYTGALVPACISCHIEDTTARQVAPTLLNYSEIAGTRIDGQGAYTYTYNSIRYANQHVVEGFVEGVMPVYDGILTDQEVYDLIAYIWTLDSDE